MAAGVLVQGLLSMRRLFHTELGYAQHCKLDTLVNAVSFSAAEIFSKANFQHSGQRCMCCRWAPAHHRILPGAYIGIYSKN